MSSTRNRRSLTVAAAVIILIIACCCIVMLNVSHNAYAFTTSNVGTSASDVGDILLEDYTTRNDGKVFNAETLEAMYAQITGTSGATLDTVSAKIDSATTYGGQKIYNSNDIRNANKALNNNTGKDIVLTMDGMQWTVTSLVKVGSDVIATLWLASTSYTHAWNSWYQNVTNVTYPSNVYGTSYVRAEGLNIGGGYVAAQGASSLTTVNQSATHPYAKFTMSSVSGSLTNFLVKPSQVAYQGVENQYPNSTIGGIGYSLPNEAYGTPTGSTNWYSNSSKTVDMSTMSSKAGYTNWSNDLIWLPSLTETGYSSSVYGIWGLSDAQRSNSAVSWLRSGGSNYANGASYLAAAGSSVSSRIVTSAGAVRPALHLNLSSAALSAAGLGLTVPEDFEVTYNGEEQGIAAADWYKADVHGDASIINITYSPASHIDAGKYTVTLKIVDGESVWKDSTDENDLTRSVTMTINKKPIALSLSLDSGGLPTASIADPSQVYSRDTGQSAPAIGFTYTSTDGGGYNSDTLPTAVGSYKASAKITNECNYTVDTTKTYEITFKIDKASITKPVISGLVSKPYSGEAQTFTLLNVSDKVSLTLPSGMTYADGVLSATNAGTYTVRVALADGGAATIWADGQSASYDITVTITKKPLTITITAPSSWKVGETPTITILGDSLAQDTTELYIYYCKHGSSVKYDDINNNKEIEGKLRTIVMPELEQGSYYIGVELYGERQGNNNYEILSGVKTHEFSVLGNDITFTEEDLNWICNNNPVTDTAFTYTGNPFRFAIDDSNLAAMGVKVDTTKGTNGYSGDITATNAKTGTYSVIVYITSYDSSFNAFDAQYTLTYTIEKAKYDLSGLTWNYDDNNPLQFIAGKTQGITLSGSLPTGLTVSYVGNDKIPVGDYTTTASFNISDAANYVRPVSTDPTSYTGDFVWSKSWKIVPAVLDVAGLWKIDEREDAATYNLPLLQGIGSLDIDSMVTYKYYDYTGGVMGGEINIGDIDMNEEHRFLAVAELKPEYTANYILQGGSYDFTVGKDRYPVIVKMDLDGQTLPYKPEGYTPNVTVNSIGGLTVSNITLTYYKDGSTVGSTDTPVAVGKYVVRATLNYGSDDNFIEEGSEFSFEIVKADIDVSGLIWQYTHGDVSAVYDFTQSKWVDGSGAEVSPFIYDGGAHTLTLSGTDTLAAVTVSVSGNLSETGAGGYTAKAAFSYDADCYNAPNFAPELSWTVGKATVNTDNMVWGYIIGTDTANEYPYTGPLVYTRVNGAAVEYSVMLINVPDALKDCITVLNNGSDSVSIKGEAGSFRAKFTIDDSKFDSANYEPYVLPSGLNNFLDWVISPRVIEMPEYDNSWSIFDDNVHDFAEMFGLQDNWADYVAISIKLDGEAYSGLDDTGVDGYAYKAIRAGEYTVNFSLINAGNNIKFSSRPQPDIRVSVDKFTLTIQGWVDNDEYSTADVPNGVLPVYYDYRYVDADGNILTADEMEVGSYYYREVYVKPAYEGSAEVKGETKYEFMMPVPPDVVKTPIAKPVLKADTEIYYDGKDHVLNEEFLADLLENFDPEHMEIITAPTANDADSYTVTFKLTSGIYAWDNGDGTTSEGDLDITVTVKKAQLPSNWNTSGSKPAINVPNDFNGLVEFDYIYTDADGNVVAEGDLQPGVTYNVTAKLKPEYAGNFEFIDEQGQVTPDATVSMDCEFEYTGNSSGDGSGNGNGSGGLDKIKNFFDKLLADNFPLWQICTAIVAIILTLVFMGKSISYGNRRKKELAEKKKLDARTYGAAAMLPIFAPDIVLLNLSNMIWSIIAFVLVGVCVIMFAVMLITRSRWSKAVAAKEQAVEDDIQRKTEAQNAKLSAVENSHSTAAQESEQRLIAMQQELEAKRVAMQQEAEARRLAREEELEAKRLAMQEEAEARRIAREEEMEAKRIAREEEMEAKRLAWQEEEEKRKEAERQEEEKRRLKAQEEEKKRRAKEQEEERKRIEREEELEAQRIAREKEMEERRLAWEEEERAERKRRMQWEEEERKLRMRDNDTREKRYLEQYAKREEELMQRDESINVSLATILETLKSDKPRGDDKETKIMLASILDELKADKQRSEDSETKAMLASILDALKADKPRSEDKETKAMFAAILDALKADKPRSEDSETKAMFAAILEALKADRQRASADNMDVIVDKVVAKLLPALQQLAPVQTAPAQNATEKVIYVPYNAGESEAAADLVSASVVEDIKKNEKFEDIDDEDSDVDEEWDSDDEEDWGAEQSTDEDGKVRRRAVNFRQRLKFSSDKNRELYEQLKNVFCAQRNVAYRVCGSVEKIKFHNDLIAVIGVAKRSLKLWLALDPAQFDEERYYHKDVSDKARFASVPMYVKIGSGRALDRSLELLGVLFEKFGIESKRKYVGKPLQELIFTLKGNKLLKDKVNKGLLCEAIHVHDADILPAEVAQNCIEYKDIEPIENELVSTISLDIIDEQFRDGQKVTLDKLKALGILAPECNSYNVTAGNRLTKPLIIVANGFTMPAVKMIALTGGRVIELRQI